MFDVCRETPISLTAAAKTLPGQPHIATLHRWRLRGVRGVRLETVLVGGRRFTTQEALQRFFSATTAATNGGESPEVRTNKSRQQAIERAEAELREAGI